MAHNARPTHTDILRIHIIFFSTDPVMLDYTIASYAKASLIKSTESGKAEKRST